jgi:hypothetical protein
VRRASTRVSANALRPSQRQTSRASRAALREFETKDGFVGPCGILVGLGTV